MLIQFPSTPRRRRTDAGLATRRLVRRIFILITSIGLVRNERLDLFGMSLREGIEMISKVAPAQLDRVRAVTQTAGWHERR
jgi:hypothetical protein